MLAEERELDVEPLGVQQGEGADANIDDEVCCNPNPIVPKPIALILTLAQNLARKLALSLTRSRSSAPPRRRSAPSPHAAARRQPPVLSASGSR